MTLIFLLMFSCSKNTSFNTMNSKVESYVPSASSLDVDSRGLSLTKAIVKTVYGNVEISFYPKEAPNTVTRIIQLIQSGFYDGLTFHKVIPNYIVQTGDPQGNGLGGSGVKLKAESNNLRHIRGAVAIARGDDPDSADSQFYISLGNLSELDGKFTVFAQVTKGIEIVERIRKHDKVLQLSLRR